MTTIHQLKSYRIGSDLQLTEDQKLQLVSCFEKPMSTASGILGGRAAVSTIYLNGIGPAIVKHYTRGGIIRKFNHSTYIKFSRYRCQVEYELLLFLKRLGITVPDPIAFAWQGKVIYHAWLITREIQNARTLAEVSRHNPDTVRRVMPELRRQMGILVENQIHHVDLHPGNVLVNHHNDLFIIDFDKAGTRPQNRKQLHQKYIRRWQRAVKKYKLPAVLDMIDTRQK